MNTRTHLVAPEEVMALLDGELSAERAHSISAHVDECAECRELADSLRGNAQALSDWTVPAAPASFDFEERLFEVSRSASAKSGFTGVTQLAALLRRHWVLTTASSALLGGIALAVSMTSFTLKESASRAPMGPYTLAGRGQDLATDVQLGGTVGGSIGKLAAGKAADQNGLYFGNQIDADGGASRAATVRRLQEEQLASNLANPQTRLLQQPMIARTVSLSVLVKDFGASRAALDAILARHNAYAAQLSSSTEENSARSLQASLRVPAAELNAAVTELKSLGQVQNETQNGDEVTQQHADLVARLNNSRETEQRLQSILQQRTGKISDVLAVEQEIARVRGEIEQMEAEQKSLEHRVNFATIDLKLAEEYKAQLGSPSPAISTRLHNAGVTGYREAVETIVGIILFCASYGPSMLVWLTLLFPVPWLLWRRWRRGYAAFPFAQDREA
jgi:hypothetical protein